MSDALFRNLGEAGQSERERNARYRKISDAIYKSLFLKQRRLVDDPNPYKCLRTPRRAGKSYVCAAQAIRLCLLKPKTRVVLIGLTLKSAKNSFWRLIEDIVAGYGIEAEFNRTDLSWKFANGSYGYIFGAETMDRIERLRGDEYDLVVIDEAKSFGAHTLEYMIQDVLMPAVATRLGSIWLTGTPGYNFDGPFFYASNPGKQDKAKRIHSFSYDEALGPRDDVMWSFHTWTMQDNDKVHGQWERVNADRKRQGWAEDHPTWRRECLGEWVLDESGLVFQFSGIWMQEPERVTWRPNVNAPGRYGLPAQASGEADWNFICGIDFGWENPTAFVVMAYSRSLQELRELHSEKHSHLVLSQVAETFRYLERRYGGFEAVVVDAGAQGDQIYQTLNTDYGIPAQPAEKREKQSYIQIVNSDFHGGKIKLLENSQLMDEVSKHYWNLEDGSREELARKGRLKEHPSSPNDLCDAFLYTWRYSAHRWYEAIPEKPLTPDAPNYWEDRDFKAMNNEIERRRSLRAEAEFEQGTYEVTDLRDFVF